MATSMPTMAQKTDTIAEQMVTLLKVLKTRMEVSAGKMIKAETKSEPTKLMAKTIIVAVIVAITKLYRATFTPVALAKFSSKVMAKILL